MKFKQISNTEACPISLQEVDKHVIKLYSSFVFIVLVYSLFQPFLLGLVLIMIDFSIRVFFGVKYSPLCILLTKILKITTIQPVLVDSGRKKIAAQVGLILSVFINLSYVFYQPFIAVILTSAFIFAIALDIIFNYCLACKLQTLFNKFFR